MVTRLRTFTKPKVLLIESDPEVTSIMRLWLSRHGYEVAIEEDGMEGLRAFYREQPDVVLLEVMLGSQEGWEVCSLIREVSDVPIIFVTTQDTVKDRLRGFELGADDYIGKPFDFREMIARVEAILRRRDFQREYKKAALNFGDIEIDFRSRSVNVRGSDIKLSPTEFRLLSCLINNPGQAVSPQQLLSEVWGPLNHDKMANVKIYVRLLRQRIEEDPGKPKYILTERGSGYRFAGISRYAKKTEPNISQPRFEGVIGRKVLLPVSSGLYGFSN